MHEVYIPQATRRGHNWLIHYTTQVLTRNKYIAYIDNYSSLYCIVGFGWAGAIATQSLGGPVGIVYLIARLPLPSSPTCSPIELGCL